MLTEILQGVIVPIVDNLETLQIDIKKGEMMVDTQYLENLIEKSGKKKSYLAEKCGCSVQALRLKIKGVYEFNTSQVDALCKELEIKSLTVKDKVFFCRDVDKNATKRN